MVNTIEEFIEKYDAFFKSAKFDIAHSSKGRWYFTEYNEEYGYYEYFIEFKTVEDLIDIIIRIMTFDMQFAIEEATPPFFDGDMQDIIESWSGLDKHYMELHCCLNKILESELGNIEFFKYLKTFLDEKQQCNKE